MIIDEKYGSKDLERDFGPLTFARAIWAHRKCAEISQKEFAMRLGISPQNLCDIERGRKIPSPARAAKIARLIGHPEVTWVELALQDLMRKENLDFKVSVV